MQVRHKINTEESTEDIKDEYSHIKWSTQIRMDSSKKKITQRRSKHSQHSCTKKKKKSSKSQKAGLIKFQLTKSPHLLNF